MYPLIKYGLAAGITTLSASEILAYKMRNGDSKVEPPVDNVSIIMPSYNEERYVKQSLESIRNQSILKMYPEYFEVILVDSSSTDNTVNLAKPYIDRLLIAGKGKLTARNLATNESKGNIIVATDADCVYLPHWLNSLLKPLQNPKNIAAVGSTFDSSMTFVPTKLFTVADFVDKSILNNTKVTGRNSAYWKHLYYLVGGFDTSINQLSQKTIQKEEEFNFGKKLSSFGNVVHPLGAACIHYGGERGGCRLFGQFMSEATCSKHKIGIERFG